SGSMWMISSAFCSSKAAGTISTSPRSPMRLKSSQLEKRKVHRREVDDVLDPVREPRHVLEELKARMGLMDFSAQYLQRPTPAEGNLIKREWLKTYRTPPQSQPGDIFVISWDTAMKATEIADYSVGTVWHVQGDNCYLLDLIRKRFDFPDLKREVMK